VEKLLAALGTTIDQVTSTLSISTAANGSATAAGNATAAAGTVTGTTSAAMVLVTSTSTSSYSLSERVEAAVRRLAELRGWTREEAKSKRNMEEKQSSQEQELLTLQSTLEDTQRLLRRAQQQNGEKDTEINERNHAIESLQVELARRQDDIDKLRREDNTMGNALEIERRARQKQLSELQARDGDILRMRSELENTRSANGKLLEQLSAAKERVQDLVNEVEAKAEQLRVVNASNTKLSAALQSLEKGSEDELRNRELLEKRLVEAEEMRATIAKLKTHLMETTASLKSTQDQLAGSNELNQDLEGQLDRLVQDYESNKRRLKESEAQGDDLSKERATLIESVAELKQNLSKTKEKVELEYTLRMQSEATVEALRRAGNDSRLLSMDYSERVNETEQLLMQTEEEKKHLRQSLTLLKAQLEEKENLRLAEMNSRKRGEAEFSQLKATLEKANLELMESTARSKVGMCVCVTVYIFGNDALVNRGRVITA
jgi:chromosome segregation ATPase